MNDNIGIYNHTTGENIVRQLTDEEQVILDQERAKNTENREKRLAEQEAKNFAKSELFQRLGITEDEARLLLS